MLPGRPELRWAYLVFALLGTLDVLIVSQLGQGWEAYRASAAPPPVAMLVAALLLALHGVLLGLTWRLVTMMRHYRRLKASFQQELDFARQVMESVAHGLTVTDDDGRFVYVNRSYAGLLGLNPEQIVGRSPLDFVPEEDREVLGQARLSRARGESSTYQTRLLGAGGQTVLVQVMGTPRWHEGRMVGSFAAVVPLTGGAGDLGAAALGTD